MTEQSKLIELAERVEALDVESQPAWMQLEAEIAAAFDVRPADFLTSLDAAMTLYRVVPKMVPSCPRKAAAEALRERANG